MRVRPSWLAPALAVALVVPFTACKRDRVEAIPEQLPPKASSSRPLEVGEASYVVRAEGLASVAIDAPLEKFRGETKRLGGYLRVAPSRLDRASGIVTASLVDFETHTFGDKDKDDTQSEHVHNWFEIGDDVKATKPAAYDSYKDVVFRIDSIDAVAPSVDLAQVPEKDGARVVTMTAKGTLWVHGRPAPKTVSMRVSFRGPPSAPSEIAFETTAPMVVSLAAHDVKPRDTTGKFLDGALSVVGKKLDDSAQVTVRGSATREASASVAASVSASASAMLARWASASVAPPSSASK